MGVASYCYYEKAPRTMNTATVSHLLSIFILFQLWSWKVLTAELFAQEFSYEESDYGDSDEEDIEQLFWLVK